MRRTNAFHPLLLVIYFVLFVYIHNFAYAPPVAIVARLLALALAAALVLWFALILATGEQFKSALWTSVLLVLFVSYGHIRNLITAWSWGVNLFSFTVGFRKLAVLALLIPAAAIGAALRRASSASIRTATVALNTAGVLLVAFTAARLIAVELRAHATPPDDHAARVASAPPSATLRKADLPDIYYIIVDTYGRSDVLRDLYGYDNGGFIDWLEDKGFYVADQSTANYSQTMLSLASSLNLSYLDPIALRSPSAAAAARSKVRFNWAATQLFAAAAENERLPLALMIQNSEVVTRLKNKGYRFVAFTSGYGGVQFPHADVVRHSGVMTDFEESVIGTTPLPDLFERVFDQRELQRQQVEYVFDHLADSFGRQGPVFVFAHIMSPHSPFVFRADGSVAPPRSHAPSTWYDDDLEAGNAEQQNSFVNGYREQVAFVDTKLRETLDRILADTSRQRMIIIQGDHGPNMMLKLDGPTAAAATERLSILNAYYVPSTVREYLYPAITPVNTFRVLFNRYFGEPDTPLPDRNYLSPGNPYDFIDMTGKLESHTRSSD